MSIIFKTGKTENKNLEIIYDMFNFKGIKTIQFKVGDENYKNLWLKANIREVGLYANNKLISILFNDLQSAYQYLLKNKDTLYKNRKSIEVKYDKGKKSISRFSLIELDAIIDLLNLLQKRNVIREKVNIIKSNIDLKPIDSFQKEKFVQIVKSNIEKSNKEKEFFVKICFNNSSIVEYAKDKTNYEQSRNLYNLCKEKYNFEKVQLIRLFQNEEKVLYTKNNNSKKRSAISLNLLGNLVDTCQEIIKSKERLQTAMAVIDKKIDILKHEIECTTFSDDLMQYKVTIDTLKKLLDERRDIKEAHSITEKSYNQIKDLDLNIYSNVCKNLKKYRNGAIPYMENSVDIVTYKYKDEEEYKKLLSHFENKRVRNDSEKKELYIYNNCKH